MRELLKHTYIVTVKPKTQSTVQTCTTFFPLFFFFFTLFKQLQFVTIKLQLQFVTVKTNYLNFNKGEKKRKKNVHGGYIYAGCQVVWLGSRDLGFSNRDLGKRAGNFAI